MFRVLLVVVSACAVLLSDPCNVAASSSFSSSSSPSDSDVSSDSVPSSSSSSSSSHTPQHHQLSKLRQQIRVIQDELKEPNIESSGENENERFMDADKNVASDDDENDDDEGEPSDDSGSSADSNSAEKSEFFWGAYGPSYELAHAYKAAVRLTDAAKANGAHHSLVSVLEAHENNLKNRVNLVHHLYPSVVPYRPSSVLKSQARAELGYHWWSHYPLFPHYVFPDYGATNVYDPAFALSYANYNYNAYRNGNYNYNAYRNGNNRH